MSLTAASVPCKILIIQELLEEPQEAHGSHCSIRAKNKAWRFSSLPKCQGKRKVTMHPKILQPWASIFSSRQQRIIQKNQARLFCALCWRVYQWKRKSRDLTKISDLGKFLTKLSQTQTGMWVLQCQCSKASSTHSGTGKKPRPGYTSRQQLWLVYVSVVQGAWLQQCSSIMALTIAAATRDKEG